MTPDQLRARLAARGSAGDGTGAWPAPAAGTTLAAVLVPLVTHADGLTMILTQRTEHLNDHAGQISFPGGRIEPGDDHPAATALRETEEEIGIANDRIEVVGRLGLHDIASGFAVVPVIGFVAPPIIYTLDAFEVAEAFEVPLDFLLDPANRQIGRIEYGGRMHDYFYFDYNGRMIWGATARMIVDLVETLIPRISDKDPS
jgi:8-oxo-dGTP pyrophosphatase MutT (NUDIX family)